jgi:NADH:ubiquinone oxidoreductase subunit 3 (subunit A)
MFKTGIKRWRSRANTNTINTSDMKVIHEITSVATFTAEYEEEEDDDNSDISFFFVLIFFVFFDCSVVGFCPSTI